MEVVEMMVESDRGTGLEPSSSPQPPSSVAKTPYGLWVGSTPSPQPNVYRSNQAPLLADATNTQAYVDPRSQYMVAEMPPVMPQQLHYSMHQAVHVPWGMFPGTC